MAMITRVSLTLDPVDVDLLDRLARAQGINRSEQVRQILAESRPMLRQTVETLEAALRQRDEFLQAIAEAEAAGLSELIPEVQRVQDSILGALARLEGAMAAHEARDDPRASNHGGHTPTPPPEQSTE